MKSIVILVLAGALVAGVVVALKSTLSPPKYGTRSAGVTGPLALGAVSRMDQRIPVWHEPRGTVSKADREALLAGTMESGDRFRVLNHVSTEVLWVRIEGLDKDLRGWIRSPPDDPVHASRAR